MGAERRVVFDLINVVQGDAKLAQALIRDKRVETLSLLAASQTRDKDALNEDGVQRVVGELKREIRLGDLRQPRRDRERGAALAMRFADRALVVTNPEVSSVRDSDRIIGLLDSKTLKAETGWPDGEAPAAHPVRSRCAPSAATCSRVDDVLEILSIPLLGIIPDSEEVLKASNLGAPVTLSNRRLRAPARAYFDAAKRLLGQPVPMTVHGEKGGLAEPSVREAGGMSFFGLFSPAQHGPDRAGPAADPAAARTCVRRRQRPGRGACRRKS